MPADSGEFIKIRTQRKSASPKVILFDLAEKKLSHILPEFNMAGNGGVDWNINGNLYFTAISELPFENPSTVEEFKQMLEQMTFTESNLMVLTSLRLQIQLIMLKQMYQYLQIVSSFPMWLQILRIQKTVLPKCG